MLAPSDRRLERLLHLNQLGESDDVSVQKEMGAFRARRTPAEATVARLSVSGQAPRIPEISADFAARCKTLRNRVEEEVDAGRLKEIAGALQRSVSVQRANIGALGSLESAIPHRSERVEGAFLTIARTWAKAEGVPQES